MHFNIVTADEIEERRKRQEAVDFAIASVRLSGFVIDDWSLAQYQRYVEGEITSDELLEIGRARYRKPNAAELRRRQESVNFIVASDRLEGITHHPETLDQMRRYVAGEVTTDELLEEVREQVKREIG